MIVFLIFLFNLAVKLLFLPALFNNYHATGLIFKVDSYFYLLKSLEIINGNLTPLRTHGIGWPLFAAPFLSLFNEESLFTNMVYAQFLNVVVGAIAIFPLYLIAREFLSKKQSYLVLLAYSLLFWPIFAVMEFFSEPLFTLLLLLTVYFSIKAQNNSFFFLLASLVAGLSYWVKPNGIFLLIFVLVVMILERFKIWRKKELFLKIIMCFVIFFAIASPFLYQRYLYFNSPFYYGENSKLLVGTYQQLWGQRISSPTLAEYLSNRDFKHYFNRFVFFGLGGVTFSFIFITLPLSFFFIWGFIKSLLKKELVPLTFSIIIWFLAFIPLYSLYFSPRHFFPLLPIAAIFIIIGGLDVAEHISNKRIFLAINVFLMLMFLGAGFLYPQFYFIKKRSERSLEMSRWIAENIKGTIAAASESDFIMMNLSDTVAGLNGLLDMKAPLSKISVVYPGFFQKEEDLRMWMTANNVRYLLLERDYETRLDPQQLRIFKGRLSSENFKLIRFDYDPSSSWRGEFYELIENVKLKT